MLPFNMRDAIIASVLTSASHTIVLSVCLSSTPEAKEHLVWQVGAPLHSQGRPLHPTPVQGVSVVWYLEAAFFGLLPML